MATDFFDHQLVAKKRTSLLVGYFVMAVVLIILSVYTVVTGCLLAASKDQGAEALWDWGRLALVAAGVGILVVSGSLYKIATLREGGAAVARLLGGELVNPSDATPAQRRLLNVVEEMAIASGTPVPSVYVLPEEVSINAFAAGYEPGDAVIGVSQGSIDHLTRDELQGVIAHEFSHILNGDMRLNLRLIGLLHGILLIALVGYFIVRVMGESSSTTRRSDSKDGDKGGNGAFAFLLLGLGLMAVGYVGVFFGRLIKSAISRQREFLADASAVQFTRNPDGIVGALKKIGGLAAGSLIRSPNAEQASHLFFSAGVPFWAQMMATHPPLVERIRRIEPTFDGVFPTIDADAVVPISPAESRVPPLPRFAPEVVPPRVGDRRVGPAPAEIRLDPQQAVASVGAPSREHVAFATALLSALPDSLAETAREPFGARSVIYALLLDQDPGIRNSQVRLIADHSAPGTAEEVLRVAPLIDALDDRARLPLADMAMPALRRLSSRQYASFRELIEPLIRADQRRSLFEFTLQRMLLRHLDRHFEQRPPAAIRYQSLEPLIPDCVRILSTLSRLGGRSEAEAHQDFAQGVQALGWDPSSARLAPVEECSMVAIDRALDHLALAAPPIKRQILDACATSIAADGLVTIAETELLRAIADSLDCPMPPLLESEPGVYNTGKMQMKA